MKKSLLLLIILLIAGCTSPLAGADKVKFDKIELKAEKSKILESKTIDWIVETKDSDGKTTGEIINKGKIEKYDYITDKKVTDSVDRFKIGEIYSNIKSVKYSKKETGETTTDFWIGDHYYKDSKGDIYEIEHGATTTIDNFKYQTATTTAERIMSFLGFKIAKADTSTYYASAGDGRIYHFDSSWSDCRDALSGDNVQDSNATGGIGANNHYYDRRAFYPVDTSGLGSGASITSATMYVYLSSKQGSTVTSQHLIGSNQTSTSGLTGTDYGTMSYTSFSEIGSADWTNSSYNGWSMNATGLAYISKTGYTKLSIIDDDTLDDTAPGSTNCLINHTFSEETGTNQDPYISITYTAGGGGTTPTVNYQSIFDDD